MTSPRENLRAVEYIYRMPGTERLYAVIRHVEVLDGERRVMVWRAVTHAEPRQLIGYWPDLSTAAMRTHMHALRVIQKMPRISDEHGDPHDRPVNPRGV